MRALKGLQKILLDMLGPILNMKNYGLLIILILSSRSSEHFANIDPASISTHALIGILLVAIIGTFAGITLILRMMKSLG